MCSIIPYGLDDEYDECIVGKDGARRLSVTDLDRAVLLKDACMELPKDGERLWLAAECGNADQVERCLRDGMSVDAQDPEDCYSALLTAAECGHLEVVKILLERGRAAPDLADAFGRTPLYAAAVAGSVEVVAYLVPYSNLEAEDEDGRTAAWAALATRRIETAAVLVDAGADVLKVDKYGQSPRDFASRNGHADVLCFLDEFT